ncbi:myosin-binding protein H isoform 2-T2 [Vipera latastei]
MLCPLISKISSKRIKNRYFYAWKTAPVSRSYACGGGGVLLNPQLAAARPSNPADRWANAGRGEGGPEATPGPINRPPPVEAESERPPELLSADGKLDRLTTSARRCLTSKLFQRLQKSPRPQVRRNPRHLTWPERETSRRPSAPRPSRQLGRRPKKGKPKPQVTWTKESQPLDPKRVVIRNTEKDSVFFMRAAQRKDSGKYQISVKILDEFEDVATFDLLVIEKPGPPENLKVVDIWGFNVALEWSPPQDKGNADLKGYKVQKADMKTQQWFTVLEHYKHTSCTVSDLIIGNSYSFRVFSENPCGLSEMPAVTKDVTHITKSGIVYKPEKFCSRDFCEAPKFTQPLIDRTTTQGYSTQLVCCVRGFPKPKVIWMKNQREIQEDPKYLVHMDQGICCLEIRKPSPFDGGIYTCKAVNPFGEASVDCKLNIKVPE